MIKKILRRASFELSKIKPASIRDKLRLLSIDASFDLLNSVETGGARRLRGLTIDSPNRKHGVDYRAVYPDEFSRGMDALQFKNYGDYTFVDLGSGKGRALLLAQAYHFKRYVGVEFAKELHTQARANVLDYQRGGRSIECLCMDATQYKFPEGPLVVFLYNPFGAEVMEKVAQNLVGLDAYIVYINPFYLWPWTKCGFKVTKSGPAFAVLRALC